MTTPETGQRSSERGKADQRLIPRQTNLPIMQQRLLAALAADGEGCTDAELQWAIWESVWMIAVVERLDGIVAALKGRE